MNIQSLFEDELRKREIVFTIDSESGRHALEIGGGRMLVSLDNLRRDFEVDGDADRVTRFVDTIIDSVDFDNRELSVERLYWCMEPNDYVDKAEFRVSISKSVDRVLVHLSSAERLVTWVTHGMLEALKMSEADASAKAFDNLARALAEATIEISDIDNVALGYLGTTLPFKTSLILAPNIKEVLGEKLDWPLNAVAPDRDFLYLWGARHTEFVQRVGPVVVREYSQAAYPLSMEIYEIADQGFRAVGAFRKNE